MPFTLAYALIRFLADLCLVPCAPRPSCARKSSPSGTSSEFSNARLASPAGNRETGWFLLHSAVSFRDRRGRLCCPARRLSSAGIGNSSAASGPPIPGVHRGHDSGSTRSSMT